MNTKNHTPTQPTLPGLERTVRERSSTYITEADYIVVEQVRKAWYTPHIFTNFNQYRAWQQANPDTHVIRPSEAHGRAKKAIDHRAEVLSLPVTDDTPIMLSTVIGRASFVAGVFAGWRKDTTRAAVAFFHPAAAEVFKQQMLNLGCTVHTEQLPESARPWSKHLLVIVEHADIPDRACEAYFGSITAASAKLMAAYGEV